MNKNITEKIKKIQSTKEAIILSIESSCDETSIAVVKNGREVLSNVISSQIDIHTRFGGVVPEVASRNHTMSIVGVLNEALKQANITLQDIDAIAVTYGAGLVGALLVGVSFAKGLSYALNIPLIAVNHIRGHVAGNYLTSKELTPPFICLIVSGGHSAIVKVESYTNQKLIGTTQDDAVGEAYDKVARVLGLGYPGGPKIDMLAKQGKADMIFVKKSALANSYNFSFSGIKTAVINYLHKLEQNHEKIVVENICASFQKEVVEELVEKTFRACKEFNINKCAVAGGVSANSYLRERMKEKGEEENISVFIPSFVFCTDNAAMIGSVAYYNILENVGLADLDLNAVPNIPL